MAEYLTLLKLNPGKIVDAINALRSLPQKPSSGVDLCYTMNIFGAWDVGVWLNAETTSKVADFVSKKIREIPGVNDIYTVPTFPHGNAQNNRSAEYLTLLKLNPGKIVDAINALRSLPQKPSSGVDLCYTMNIFGAWDVGVWLNAETTSKVADFVSKKIREIPGVNDIYTVPTFPQGISTLKTRQAHEAQTTEETE